MSKKHNLPPLLPEICDIPTEVDDLFKESFPNAVVTRTDMTNDGVKYGETVVVTIQPNFLEYAYNVFDHPDGTKSIYSVEMNHYRQENEDPTLNPVFIERSFTHLVALRESFKVAMKMLELQRYLSVREWYNIHWDKPLDTPLPF